MHGLRTIPAVVVRRGGVRAPDVWCEGGFEIVEEEEEEDMQRGGTKIIPALEWVRAAGRIEVRALPRILAEPSTEKSDLSTALSRAATAEASTPAPGMGMGNGPGGGVSPTGVNPCAPLCDAPHTWYAASRSIPSDEAAWADIETVEPDAPAAVADIETVEPDAPAAVADIETVEPDAPAAVADIETVEPDAPAAVADIETVEPDRKSVV